MIDKFYKIQDIFIIFIIIIIIVLILIIYPSNKIELYIGKSKAIIDKTHNSIIVRSDYNKEEFIYYKIYPLFAQIYINPIYSGSEYGIKENKKKIKIINNKKYLINNLGAYSELIIDYGFMKKKFDLYIIDGELSIINIRSQNKLLDIQPEKNTPAIIDIISSTNSYLLKDKEIVIERRGRIGLKYNIKFLKAQSVFNSQERKKWSLYGSPYDFSRLREKLAFDLYSMITLKKVVPKTFFIELFINYQYQGIYVLEEKYDRRFFEYKKYNKNTLSPALIFRCNEGIFFDKDKFDEKLINQYYDKTFKQIKPDIEKIDYRYILWDLLKFILFSDDNDFFNKKKGIFSKIDENSVIDLFLFLQLTKNVDGVSNNLFFSRKEIESKNESELFIISSWDHDKSFGWSLTRKVDHKGLAGINTSKKNYLFQRLIKNNEFKNKLKKRWFELRKDKWSNENINNTIKEYLNELNNAVYRNDNYFLYKNDGDKKFTQSDDLDFIIEWLELRLKWLDNYFLIN